MAGDGAVARVRHPRRGHSVLLAEEPEAPDAALHEAAHVADPLANDQDWALVYALRLGLE